MFEMNIIRPEFEVKKNLKIFINSFRNINSTLNPPLNKVLSIVM